MRFFSSKPGRTSKSGHINLYPEGAQHPDLPLSPSLRATSPKPETSASSVSRSATVSERFSASYAGDRRSIAVEPGYEPSHPFSPDDVEQEAPQLSGGLTRSQTVLRREGTRRTDDLRSEPSPVWSPDFAQLPTPTEQAEAQQEGYFIEGGAPMNHFNSPGKTSTDSGQSSGALDRWSQRRLQRLNTEQGFREQRQGGQSIYSPPGTLSETSGYYSAGSSYPVQEQQASQYNQHAQPHPSQQSAYQSERAVPASANAGPSTQAQLVSSSTSRPSNYQRQESSGPYVVPVSKYSPPQPSLPNVSAEDLAPAVSQSRSYGQQQQQGGGAENISMSSSNNGSLPAPKPSRSGGSNRQSVHNGINSRETSGLGAAQQTGGQQGGVPAFNASVVPPTGQSQTYPGAMNPSQQQSLDIGRKTPQPYQTSEEMTEEDVNALLKDHKELREKYTKVKKYYFEKEDQVKQLQNSLAHQRLSQSRTSLDDSEYTTRFNRLDGLVAQLAFSIRKSWRSVPHWLMNSVNKDAIATGKQEMTAAGRAFISCWLVDEVFDKYFHPDLDPRLSAELKSIQRNIRRFAPPAQTAEEEEYLTSKVVNWRLSTLEGLQELLRSPSCPANRAQLTDSLKEHLVGALAVHLQEPAPSDLEGGVHMIIELVVSIAIHLPLESRDVVIDYFLPGYSILNDQMKLESGIPPLTMSIADDAAERGSVKSGDSEDADTSESSNQHGEHSSKARSMLSAITGTTKSKSGSGDSRKHAGAGESSNSLSRPDSSQGMRQDLPPRVRMTAGIGVQIRGRSVLVKAPVFATS